MWLLTVLHGTISFTLASFHISRYVAIASIWWPITYSFMPRSKRIWRTGGSGYENESAPRSSHTGPGKNRLRQVSLSCFSRKDIFGNYRAFPRIVNNSWKGICLFLFAVYSQVSQKRILIQKDIETRKEVSKSSSMLYFRNFISRKSTVCMNARGGRKKSLFNSEIRSDVGTIRSNEWEQIKVDHKIRIIIS